MDTMDIIKKRKENKYPKKYHIYKIIKDNLHMNDTSTPTTQYSRHYTSLMPDNSSHLQLHYKSMISRTEHS
jgi:hypothetical protein